VVEVTGKMACAQWLRPWPFIVAQSLFILYYFHNVKEKYSGLRFATLAYLQQSSSNEFYAS